jgi:hypothetical protein
MGEGQLEDLMADNGPASTMPMGNNGVISDGGGPNVAGPTMAKPESKGNFGRIVPPLTPTSQTVATPVNIVDDDAWANNEFGAK